MTYEQLRSLEAIVTAGSFRAASEFLHRSQPAVSVAIKNLEEELGLQLFSRDEYRPVLTPEGHAFYQASLLALNSMRSLETLGKQLALGSEPRIGIAIDAICPLPLILDLLRKAEKEHPSTEFHLSVENLGGTLERLMDGEANLAILPWVEEYSGLESICLIKVQMIPVAAPHFPPAQAAHELREDEMKKYVQVIVKDSSQHSPRKTIGVLEGGRHWTVNDHFTKKQIILEGLGWGRLSSHLIEDELRQGKLVPLHIKSVKPAELHVCVARKADQPVGPVAARLWETFQQLSPGHPFL